MKEYYTMFCDYFISDPIHYFTVVAAVFVICLICITFDTERRNKVAYGNAAKPDPSDYVFATFLSFITGLLWPIIIISLGTLLIAVVPIWIGKGIFYLVYGLRKRE